MTRPDAAAMDGERCDQPQRTEESMIAMKRRNLRARSIMRYDPSQRMIRVGRVMWERGTVGDGKGYSVKLSVGIRPALFNWRRESTGWLLTFCGVRLHLDRSYGGINV